MNALPPSRSKRSRRKIVLIPFVLLLLSGLLLLAGCSAFPDPYADQSTPTSVAVVPQTTPTPGPAHGVTLRDLHMVDNKNGWAMTTDNHILHTTAGAAQWQDVTPNPGWGEPYHVSAPAFLDSVHAWVGLQTQEKDDANNRYSVFYTVDGGNTWLQSPVLDAGMGISQVTFFDVHNGWLIFTKAVGAGHEAIDIFRSTDGGQSWVNSASTDETTGNLVVGDAGEQPGLGFATPLNGWLTGSINVENSALLYMTTDGGVTWRSQGIVHATVPNALIATSPPIFFDAQHGIMPATFSVPGGEVQLAIYSSKDGGATWDGSGLVPGLTGQVSFLDAQHGWAAGSDGTVAATSDGGQHWAPVAGKLPVSGATISRLNFVSATTGWVLATLPSEKTALLQTSDGGKTWTQLITTASA